MKAKDDNLSSRLFNYSLAASTVLACNNINAALITHDINQSLDNTGIWGIDFSGGTNYNLWVKKTDAVELLVYFKNSLGRFLGSNNGGRIYPYAKTNSNTASTTTSKWHQGSNTNGKFYGTAFWGTLNGVYLGNFPNQTEKYLHIRFRDNGNDYYGWVKITLNVTYDDGDNDYSSTGTIHGCGYDDSGAMMPVELTSFNAVHFENAVKLLWETATEVNNYGFEVERASFIEDGTTPVQGWETIGFVEGYGNSNSPKSYEFIDETAPAANLEYRLKQIDTDGNYEYYSLTAKVDNNVTDVQENSLPLEFALEQNYPNPFNPETVISYQLSAVSKVELRVFDLLGKEVATLVNKEQAAGNYSINFKASNLPSGMYVYRITAGEFTQSRKMLLLR